MPPLAESFLFGLAFGALSVVLMLPMRMDDKPRSP